MISLKMTEEYLAFTEDEFARGSLHIDSYEEILMRIASEFLLTHNNEEKAMRTLNKVSEHFIQNVLPRRMESDIGLAQDMLEFAYHLERRGITFEGVIKPTQGEAKA